MPFLVLSDVAQPLSQGGQALSAALPPPTESLGFPVFRLLPFPRQLDGVTGLGAHLGYGEVAHLAGGLESEGHLHLVGRIGDVPHLLDKSRCVVGRGLDVPPYLSSEAVGKIIKQQDRFPRQSPAGPLSTSSHPMFAQFDCRHSSIFFLLLS